MALLQPLFSKPKLSSKLLSKPPFRFIHDILTATIESTGFPDGLFAPQELDSSSFKDDKHAKLAFLEKIIHLVNVGSGSALEVSSSKIIAGLEPLNTNILLMAFARLALDKDLDRSLLVKHCVNGLGIEEYQLLLREAPQGSTAASSVADVKESDIISAWQEEVSANAEAANNSMKRSVEECNEDINQTREMIARVIAKPTCSDKLLSKPPFRFLHDIFMAIGKATGFNLGRVFRNEEMDSTNINNKQNKIEFLEKLIRFLESELEISTDVKPSKIVAGLEAEKTRYLLQLFVVVATTPKSLAVDHKAFSTSKQHDKITTANEIGVRAEETKRAPPGDFMEDDSNLSPAKTRVSFVSSDVKQATVSKTPSMPKDEKIDHERIVDKILTDRLSDCYDGGDKELPMFESWENDSREAKEVEAVNSTGSRMQLRLHRPINHRPITALMLPTTSSTTDYDSIAAAIQGITQTIDLLGRYMDVVNNDIEEVTREKSHWVKEIQDMEQVC
ncbi:hypothetical protein ACHAW6_012792 [Cyclotella cf. meneghiniana]